MRHQICESQIGRVKMRMVEGGGVLCCFFWKSGSLAPETYSLTDKRSAKIGHLSGFSRRGQKRASFGDEVNILVKNGE
jgi:hypothetical protein